MKVFLGITCRYGVVLKSKTKPFEINSRCVSLSFWGCWNRVTAYAVVNNHRYKNQNTHYKSSQNPQ